MYDFILYRLIFCVLNYVMWYNLNYYVIRKYMIVYIKYNISDKYEVLNDKIGMFHVKHLNDIMSEYENAMF